MFTFIVKVKKMTQSNVALEAVFKHFDGFRIAGIQRHTGFNSPQSLQVELERNGVLVSICGHSAEVENLISFHPAKYWDGGQNPVIGQEFRSKNTDRAYTVEFPVYRGGILIGCYGYSDDVNTAIFVSIADMMPGREPLTEGQKKAIDDVLYMHKSKWITLEQSDEMIAIIKKSTKS